MKILNIKKKWEEVFIRYYKLINEYQEEEEENCNKNEVKLIFNYYNLCKKKNIYRFKFKD
jgi:hypothetical protein